MIIIENCTLIIAHHEVDAVRASSEDWVGMTVQLFEDEKLRILQHLPSNPIEPNRVRVDIFK